MRLQGKLCFPFSSHQLSQLLYGFKPVPLKMLHHLMIGTWTRPGAIFTVVFDDDKLTLELAKRTEIPHDEPISWMTFNVSLKKASER
jgi:hypothetical protein